MKKPISILSIIAIVLSVLSLLWATALLFGFWEQVCIFVYNMSEEVIAEGPILPIGITVSMVGIIVFVVVAYICSKSCKTIAGEVMSIVALSVVLPVISTCLAISQTTEIASGFGTYSAQTALNISNNIFNYTTWFTGVSKVLCYVVCGMSITEKIHTKKTIPSATQVTE